jgi:HK97 family phage major capsid protein
MNRKTLIRLGRENGWTGKTLESFKSWATDEGIEEMKVGGETVTLDQIDTVWAKTVTVSISADAGEDVAVEDASEAAVEEMVDEDEDATKSEDEDEAAEKSAKIARSKSNVRQWRKASVPNVRTSKTGYNSKEARTKAAYDQAVSSGEKKFMGKDIVFSSADEQEQFGAAARLCITKGGHQAYNKLADDIAIVGTKAGSTTDNAWAGTLIVSEVAPAIIDLLHQYGAARQLAGVTDMPDGVYDTKRKTADMSFAYTAENDTIAETNPTYDQVELVAKKMAGIARLSNELLNDSAFDLGGEVARSTRAGANLFEDQDFFNGTHGAHGGLAGAMDSDSTYDAALSASWDDYTIAKLQAWIGKVPAEAWADGSVKIAASSAFYHSVLRRFALSAGGNTGNMILDGVGGGLAWDGIPVILSEVLPSTYTGDQTVAYIGSFERGSKFGVVRGSEELTSSSDRYWDQDQFAWRFKQRLAFNFHDCGGTASEVIALQD